MLQYTKQNIANMMFLDIETVREYATFAEFKAEKNFETWKKIASKHYDAYPEYNTSKESVQNEIDEEIYLTKAPLFPEYAKIVCIGFGFITLVDGTFEKKTYAIGNVDEVLLLNTLASQLNKAHEKNLNTIIVGHNVFEYDIPFIIKRMIKLGIKIPIILTNVLSTKPWEAKVLDTIKDWRMGSTKYVSLEALTEFLGIPSPKHGEVNGSSLSLAYWASPVESIPKIITYCKGDIDAEMDVVIKLEQV